MRTDLRILTVIGARPQIIKAAAISRAIRGPFKGRIQERLLHTGQHYDANMSQVFFDELDIPLPDIQLGVGSGDHGIQTARMMEGIERALKQERPDLVLVYGDTNSTLAGALAAAKLHIPIAHVEAGLRSFNKAMPEEINRIVSDHCSTWLFCPTQTAVANLEREGLSGESPNHPTADHPRVVHCGDVMYDNSLHFAPLAAERSRLLSELGLANEPYALVTIHRDSTTDIADRLNAIIASLIDLNLAYDLPLVMPLHPRTHARIQELLDPVLRKALYGTPDIHALPPAGFLDMIALEQGARLVLTDSGGVQKEAYFFGKPCIILRAETEWVELVQQGQAVLVDADHAAIHAAAATFLNSAMPESKSIFGDGRAAERICSELLS